MYYRFFNARYLSSQVASVAAAIPNVMLFYESLCSGCEQEMKTGVTEALNKFGDNVFFRYSFYISSVPDPKRIFRSSTENEVL